MRQILSLEPALVRGVVVAVFSLLAGSGVAWATDDTAATVAGVITAALAIAQSVWTRSVVTPAAAAAADETDEGEGV